MKRAIWISYDLGVRGDYESLYRWLDDQHAKECVGNVAFLNYECKGNPVEALKDDLTKAIEINKKTRIYAVWRDMPTKKVKGRFVFGGRRIPQWSGYGTEGEAEELDES